MKHLNSLNIHKCCLSSSFDLCKNEKFFNLQQNFNEFYNQTICTNLIDKSPNFFKYYCCFCCFYRKRKSIGVIQENNHINYIKHDTTPIIPITIAPEM